MMASRFHPAFRALALLLIAGSSHADIRINEFMASNDTTLADDDGDPSDWIELYNNGPQNVSLAGWFLTDDSAVPDKWGLPAINLPANGYLLVYASGKDRLDPAGYHTNFKLGKGGEYLGLIRPGATTAEDEYSPEYPAQFSDVSYGVSSNELIGFLQSPSPGAPNSALELPQVKVVPASTTFTGSLSITLEPETQLATGDVIRYTLDGRLPTSSSSAYTGPFTLEDGADVRASVFRGSDSSEANSARFIEYASDLIGFQSTLPLIVLDTRSQEVSLDDVIYTPSSVAILDTENGSATLASRLSHIGFAGARVRGSSSASFRKKSFKLELWDDDQDDLDVNVLGMGKEADWVLIAPGAADRNMIANPLMADLARDLGLQAMDWRYVELFLNNDDATVSSDDYHGIYLLFETIKTGKNRIDVADLSPGDITEPGISGGYIIKRDRVDRDEYSFSPGSAFSADSVNRVVVHRPKEDNLSGVQRDWIKGYFRDFEASILSSNPLDEQTGYRQYIEENSWIDMHILDLFSMDADMLRLSNFFYKDQGRRLVNGPVWDSDRSLNSTDERDDDPNILVPDVRQIDPFDFSWWEKLFEIDHFDEKYRRRWHALRQGPLGTTALFDRVDALADPLFEPYPREHVRWGEPFFAYGSRYGDDSNYQGEVDALKQWILERVTFLDDYLTDPGTPGCSSSTLDFPLVQDTWAMLSLPCLPPAGASVASLFGDDISGTYGTDWTTFIFDPLIGEAGNYVELSADELPMPGQGFWIIQISDKLALLDLPAESRTAAVANAIPGCTSGFLCAALELPGQSRWMLLGNPMRHAVPKSSLRVVDTSGTCAAPTGCALVSAASSDILPSPFFTYFRETSASYQSVADVGLLNEWSGFWAFGGAASGRPNQRLVVLENQ